MASRSSSDSAGEQRLEMGSWNEKKKMSTAGRRGQMRIGLKVVVQGAVSLWFKDFIDFTVHCKCAQLCFPILDLQEL